jgi:site-specific DNA-methyltransferase (adenine-specific)
MSALVMPWADREVLSLPNSLPRRRNAARWHGENGDWETPSEVYEPLDAEFHFTLDPCAYPTTAKCARFFTVEDDGLRQSWAGERVFMNPPYGKGMADWTAKAATSGALVVGLLPAQVDSLWWHRDVLAAGAEVRYIRGRVRFKVGDGYNSPFTPILIVVWRP